MLYWCRGCMQADFSYLYAASDDPADHHPGHDKFRMGSVYTMSDEEYNKVDLPAKLD